jgi:hypothetical protein
MCLEPEMNEIPCIGLNGFAEGERGIADWNS